MESKWLRIAKTWLIYVCIGLAIACGVLYREWRDEQAARRLYEATSEHYQVLYQDCQNGR